jgi:hypothetical protein
MVVPLVVGLFPPGCRPTTADESAGNYDDKSNRHDDPNQHEYPRSASFPRQLRAVVSTASSHDNQVHGSWGAIT